MPGIRAGPQGQDIDYGLTTYTVRTRQGRKGIMHAAGPLWGDGMPLDDTVWRSVEYDEVAFGLGKDLVIVDARGKFPNGNRWRHPGKFGESASYSDVDEATAKILNRFLDGACLTPQRF